MAAASTVKSVNCACGNEVAVPDGHQGGVRCESARCQPGGDATLTDAMRNAKERREKAIAAKDEDMRLRIDRIVGRSTIRYRPGDQSGAKCPQCKRAYVYDAAMALVHPGTCSGSAQVVRTPSMTEVLSKVRRPQDWMERLEFGDEDAAA